MAKKYVSPTIPIDEKERLTALYHLKVLDTLPEERFDRITKLATDLFKVPISTITLVDSDREWFKSCQGLDVREGKRAISFCGHAILEEEEFVINDTLKDKRFKNNPLVTEKPKIRFYAGIPLRSADGLKVGVFCIKDTKPRKFSKKQIENLKRIAKWAEIELNTHELSKALEARKDAERKVVRLNETLRLLNKILRHDLFNNLTVINTKIQLFLRKSINENSLKETINTVDRSIDLINQIKHMEDTVTKGSGAGRYNAENIIKRVAREFPQIRISVKGDTLMIDEGFFSVFENIIRNAYVHGNANEVTVKIRKNNDKAEISFIDNGKGIPDEIKDRIFEEGYKYGKKGHTGLGLYIVKNIVERYSGTVSVKNNKPKGAIFVLKFKA